MFAHLLILFFSVLGLSAIGPTLAYLADTDEKYTHASVAWNAGMIVLNGLAGYYNFSLETSKYCFKISQLISLAFSFSALYTALVYNQGSDSEMYIANIALTYAASLWFFVIFLITLFLSNYVPCLILRQEMGKCPDEAKPLIN